MAAIDPPGDDRIRSDEEQPAPPKDEPPPQADSHRSSPKNSRQSGKQPARAGANDISTDENASEASDIPPGLSCVLHGGGEIRALSWDDAMLHFGPAQRNGDARNATFRVPPPGIKFVHFVPMPLRRIGCMWLDQGDEKRRCGRSVTWMMGANPSLARLYCEVHGGIIYERRLRTTARRRRRESAAQQEDNDAEREDEVGCRAAQ